MIASILRVLASHDGRNPFSEDGVAEVHALATAAVMGRLFSIDGDLTLRPGLIESANASSDHTEFHLRIRDGTRFHNGRRATAHDLEFSLLRGMRSERADFYAAYLSDIVGIETVVREGALRSGDIAGLEIRSSRELLVRLSRPRPAFLHSLAHSYFSLFPAEELRADGMTWKHFPVGCGRYRVDAPFDGERSILSWSTPDAPPDRFRHIELVTGLSTKGAIDVSLIEPDADNLSASVTCPLPKMIATIFFSNANALGSSPDFRKALSLAIDRTAALKTSGLDARPWDLLLPSALHSVNNEVGRPSISEARNHLAGVSREWIEKKWEIPTFGSLRSRSGVRFLNAIAAQLSGVGLDVIFVPSDEKFLSPESAEKCPFSVSGRVTDFIDPLLMARSFRSGSAYPYERPLDAERFDRLYDRVKSEMDPASRSDGLNSLFETIRDEPIAVALAEVSAKRYYDPSVVDALGYQPDPVTLFLDRVVPVSR